MPAYPWHPEDGEERPYHPDDDAALYVSVDPLPHLPHRHEQSVWGPFCHICKRKRKWWQPWVRWQPVSDDHDEPF